MDSRGEFEQPDTSAGLFELSSDNESNRDGESGSSAGSADMASFVNDVPIDKATIGACIREDIGEDVIKRFHIPKKATFSIGKEEWSKMCGHLRGQYFENGQWHEPFIKGIKASNPYCVLMIKRHHVSLAEERKLSECKALLTADLYRKLKDCPITAKLAMNQKFTATVTYSHDVVMHHIGEQDARPIRGTERET